MKNETTINHQVEVQSKLWEARSGVPREKLENHKKLNKDLEKYQDQKTEKKPKTSIANAFAKSFGEVEKSR